MESTSDAQWYTAPGYAGKALEPITLDIKQINEILDKISDAPGATKEVKELAVQHQRAFLHEKLRNIKISPDGVEELGHTIEFQYKTAKVKSGKPVGIRCAEAFIATVMQSTLNTRHKAGAGIDVGFDAVREVIFLPAHRKKSLVFLHFLDKKSKHEILNLRSKYIYRNVQHYVVDYQYGEMEDFGDEWWHPFQRILNGIDKDAYKDVPILRLYLDTVMMAEYNTSMYEIASAITRENCSECIKCLYGPVDSGIIDLYPTENALKTVANRGGDNHIKYLFYLDQCVRPAFSGILTIVQGIPDMEALYYSYTPVMSALLSFKYLYDYPRESGDDHHYYYIEKRKDIFLFQGVNTEDVTCLLKALKGEIINETDINYIVKFDPETGGGTPEDLFKEELKKQRKEKKERKEKKDKQDKGKERKKEEEKEEEEEGNEEEEGEGGNEGEEEEEEEEDFSDETKIEKLNRHNYAILLSENLSSPLKFPDVDRSRTYCNNFHELTRVMGSEVARTYHLYNTFQVMTATKTNINARYFEFFSNVVFYRGTPTGITFTGISKQTAGFLSRSAIEQSGKIIAEGALYDQKGESTTNISTALTTGRFPGIGTGTGPYGVDFDEIDPSLVLGNVKKGLMNKNKEDHSLEVKNLVKQMTKKEGGDIVLDSAAGDENITDDNMFDNRFQKPDFLNVRRTKGVLGGKIKDEDRLSLNKIKMIINNRDYVSRSTNMTPSIITPDDIENLIINPMVKTPHFINVILGVMKPLRTKVKVSVPKWEDEQPIKMIVVSEFIQTLRKVNSHAFD